MPIFDITGFGASCIDCVDLSNEVQLIVVQANEINVGIADHEGPFAIEFDGIRVDIIHDDRPTAVG